MFRHPAPRITFDDPSSFAAFTLRERFPTIIAMAEDGASAAATVRLRALRTSLNHGAVPELGLVLEDQPFWTDFRRRWSDAAAWSELPFLEAEFALYRAILDAVEFERSHRQDPFSAAKNQAGDAMELLLVPAAQNAARLRDVSAARSALSLSLRGNTEDLSQLNKKAGQGHASSQVKLLIDDSADVVADLESTSPELIHFVLDNVGGELLGDLILIDYLLRVFPTLRVQVHAKPAPIFVSDVTPEDWRRSVDRIATHHCRAVHQLGARVQEGERSGRIRVSADPFWSRPLCFSEAPTGLARELGAGQLIVIKGDLNYRRYVEDRYWPLSSRASKHRLAGLPPTLSLRVLKSEVLVGLPESLSDTLLSREPDALFSGRNSIIQYFR